jgi:hypothetical protein
MRGRIERTPRRTHYTGFIVRPHDATPARGTIHDNAVTVGREHTCTRQDDGTRVVDREQAGAREQCIRVHCLQTGRMP